jgi:hypothetical protein
MRACIFLLCLSMVTAVASFAQHPIGYRSVKATSKVGIFTFADLDREIVKQRTASFFSESPVKLTFDVYVSADGNVKYVRPPRMDPEMHELRLACTSALYQFQFSPAQKGQGDKWYKAELNWDEEE